MLSDIKEKVTNKLFLNSKYLSTVFNKKDSEKTEPVFVIDTDFNETSKA